MGARLQIMQQRTLIDDDGSQQQMPSMLRPPSAARTALSQNFSPLPVASPSNVVRNMSSQLVLLIM